MIKKVGSSKPFWGLVLNMFLLISTKDSMSTQLSGEIGSNFNQKNKNSISWTFSNLCQNQEKLRSLHHKMVWWKFPYKQDQSSLSLEPKVVVKAKDVVITKLVKSRGQMMENQMNLPQKEKEDVLQRNNHGPKNIKLYNFYINGHFVKYRFWKSTAKYCPFRKV